MKRYTLTLLASLIATTAALPARAEFFLSVNIAPPELPVYVQPRLPGDGYVWTPGYWAYDEGDYYWVPGTWIRPPRAGLLWTPGYWAWNVSAFSFRPGYWGAQVGYYGGVNYGYGYGGHGYEGGRWDRDRFMYNRAVNNVDTKIVRNTYNTTVVKNVTINRVSYNGGTGGLNTRADANEERFEREQHVAATTEQASHERTARSKPELRRAANKGKPPIAATAKPADFDAPDVVRAEGADPKPAAHKTAVAKESGSAGAKPEHRKSDAVDSSAAPTTAATEHKPDATRKPAADAKSGDASKAAAAEAKPDKAHKAPAAEAKSDTAKSDNATRSAAKTHGKPERDAPEQAARPDAAPQQPQQTTAHKPQQKPKSQPHGAPDQDGNAEADKEARRVQKEAEDKAAAKPTQ